MTKKEKHLVNDSEIFDSFIKDNGLYNNSFIRLSPDKIVGLTDSIGCMTSGALATMMRTKYGGISGDCYAGLSATSSGEEVLIFDCVRTDKTSDPNQYVMDQDPIFLKKKDGEWCPSACKLSHSDWSGRTLDYSAYNSMTSGFNVNTPYQMSELEASAKAIYDAFPYSCDYLDELD
jgi:hypothetical protein